MKHLDLRTGFILLQKLKWIGITKKQELEKSGGGDGPDWLYIDGYYQAIEDLAKAIEESEDKNV
jgi:hypothetical protein